MNVRATKLFLACLVVGLVGGCAGGGGGGGGGASLPASPPVSPPVSPPPPPPPPTLPQVTQDSLAGPAMAMVRPGGALSGGAVFAGAVPLGQGLTVDITDPDGVYGNTTNPGLSIGYPFGSGETIRVRFSAPGSSVTVDQTYTPANASFNGGASANSPVAMGWSTNCGNACGTQATVYKLYKKRFGPNGDLVNVTAKYVNIISFVQYQNIFARSENIWGAFGLETAAADMPTTGTAVFRGESFGFVTQAPAGWSSDNQTSFQFKGDVTLDVDFGKTTGAVTGIITAAVGQPSTATPAMTPFAMNFTADRTGAGFRAGALSISGVPTPNGMTGQVQGQFFGVGSEAASEAGGVFSMQGPLLPTIPTTAQGPQIQGAFVAGR